jgi:fused signal recognition particle receptor
MAAIARTGKEQIDLRHEPAVVLMVGVNGTGKTTTIGKLAWHLKKELGQDVLLGAADTVPRRAVEQLEGWARRADVPIITPQREGQDPSSVAFDTSPRAAGAASTSSSSTPPGACTRRTSSWPS